MDLVVRCAHLPSPGETITALESLEIPGGKGANQAVAAARCGGIVTMIGRLGKDAFGDRLLASLRHEGVCVERILTGTDCASGIAVVAVESSGENSIMVVPGANGLVSRADVESASEIIRAADALLLQLEVPLDPVESAVQIAVDAGVRVILDPAPMPDSIPDGIFNADVLCPNQLEASAITGRPIRTVDEARDAVSAIHQSGVANVVITLGANGAVVSDGDSVDWIEPYRVRAVDSTAAGDAFAGALAVRLAEGARLVDAARFASAAGAIATSRLGAQTGMPSRLEIEQRIAEPA